MPPRPGPALERSLRETLHRALLRRRLARRERGFDLDPQSLERIGRLPPRLAGQVVDRSERLQLHLSRAQELARFGLARAPDRLADLLERVDEGGVLRGPVEELSKFLLLAGVARLDLEQVRVGAAVVDRAVDRPELAGRRRQRGQEVDAFAQRRAPGGLERTPDPNPQPAGGGGQRRRQDQPVRHAANIARCDVCYNNASPAPP